MIPDRQALVPHVLLLYIIYTNRINNEEYWGYLSTKTVTEISMKIIKIKAVYLPI